MVIKRKDELEQKLLFNKSGRNNRKFNILSIATKAARNLIIIIEKCSITRFFLSFLAEFFYQSDQLY